jgi:hypothetical protein
MIIVSARTESTSMARILVGPMPYTSQFVLPETTFKFYNQECGVVLIMWLWFNVLVLRILGRCQQFAPSERTLGASRDIVKTSVLGETIIQDVHYATRKMTKSWRFATKIFRYNMFICRTIRFWTPPLHFHAVKIPVAAKELCKA